MSHTKMKIRINPNGTVELSAIDYDQEKGPFWYVTVDGAPTAPERPLPLYYAAHEFQRYAREAIEEDTGEKVELRLCTRDDLEWAGVRCGKDDA